MKSDTVLYLVNSIYFGASWKNEFDEEQTKQNEDFHVSTSSSKKVRENTDNIILLWFMESNHEKI